MYHKCFLKVKWLSTSKIANCSYFNANIYNIPYCNGNGPIHKLMSREISHFLQKIAFLGVIWAFLDLQW